MSLELVCSVICNMHCLDTAAAVSLHLVMTVLSHGWPSCSLVCFTGTCRTCRRLINLPGRTSYPLLWFQAGDRNKTLLNLVGYGDLLYYSHITGNTDAAIITRVNHSTHIVRGGLCVLFALKKEINEASVYQAVCELVVASILSRQWKPVVVLSDLMEEWQLFWMNGVTVKQHAVSQPSCSCVGHQGLCGPSGDCGSWPRAASACRNCPASSALPAELSGRQVPDLAHGVLAAGASVNP